LANDTLRAALQQAGLTADDLAQIVEVNARTVRRWLAGGTPRPRQRRKVTRALDTTEHHLWPHIATAPAATQPTDPLAGYRSASDLDAPDWKALMRDSTDRIELLGDTLTPILATPGVPELLAAKATHGCHVRILVSEPGRQLAPLVGQPGIEIRAHEGPAHHTFSRFDEHVLLTLHQFGQDADQAPLLHLRRAAPGGLFDRFADHYNDLWEQHSQPIDPDHDLALDEAEHDGQNPETDPRHPAAEQPAGAGSGPSPPPPRRWPGRPA
jgi:transcriptional regulator with XRE-family HTH domain